MVVFIIILNSFLILVSSFHDLELRCLFMLNIGLFFIWLVGLFGMWNFSSLLIL